MLQAGIAASLAPQQPQQWPPPTGADPSAGAAPSSSPARAGADLASATGLANAGGENNCFLVPPPPPPPPPPALLMRRSSRQQTAERNLRQRNRHCTTALSKQSTRSCLARPRPCSACCAA